MKGMEKARESGLGESRAVKMQHMHDLQFSFFSKWAALPIPLADQITIEATDTNFFILCHLQA